MLLAYDDEGNVIGWLNSLVVHGGPDGPVGVDFAAHEANGGEHTDYWTVDGAKGSKVWPETVNRPHEFRVELEGEPGQKRITNLVRKPQPER